MAFSLGACLGTSSVAMSLLLTSERGLLSVRRDRPLECSGAPHHYQQKGPAYSSRRIIIGKVPYGRRYHTPHLLVKDFCNRTLGMQYTPLPASVRIGRLQAHILAYLGSRDFPAKTTEIAADLGGALYRNTVPSAVRRLHERGLVHSCTGHLQGSYRITFAGALALKEWQQATPSIEAVTLCTYRSHPSSAR